MVDVKNLERAASELREKMKLCRDIKRFSVKTVPDDMEIVLVAYMKDGSVKERVFRHDKKL